MVHDGNLTDAVWAIVEPHIRPWVAADAAGSACRRHREVSGTLEGWVRSVDGNARCQQSESDGVIVVGHRSVTRRSTEFTTAESGGQNPTLGAHV